MWIPADLVNFSLSALLDIITRRRNKSRPENGLPMTDSEHIDALLQAWPYNPESMNIRLVTCEDKREVLQMRVDLGVLQLETTGRPDGQRPEGEETYYDYLMRQSIFEGNGFVLDDDECDEVDREFIQFYHRRVCWLRLQQYDRAVTDADHTLGLMDFCRVHSPDEQWTVSHEQYRPFVLFQRTQAAALSALEENGPEEAVQEIEQGLTQLHTLFVEHELEEQFEDDDLVVRLTELRDSLSGQYNGEKSLQQQLTEAIAAEEYERAARIRDELERRDSGQR